MQDFRQWDAKRSMRSMNGEGNVGKEHWAVTVFSENQVTDVGHIGNFNFYNNHNKKYTGEINFNSVLYVTQYMPQICTLSCNLYTNY